MTIQEFRDKLKEDLELEPAFFVGGFGGAAVEMSDIDHMTPEELVDFAVDHGYGVTYETTEEHQKGK